MQTELSTNGLDGTRVMRTAMSGEEFINQMPVLIRDEVIRQVASKLSDEFIKEKGQEILANVNQRAIATLVVAEAGNSIKDMLDKKLPDRADTVIQKEVYQRRSDVC